MTRLQAALLLFGILFLSVFVCDYLFINRHQLPSYKNKKSKKGKKKKKKEESIEIAYLSGKFKLSKEKLLTARVMLTISLINAFIISLVAIVVMFINVNIILQLIIGFVLVIALIYAMYEIYGRMLERSEKYGI